MEEKKIKYKEWCQKYYEDNIRNWADTPKRKIEDVEELLTVRLNCFTGKNYGNKRLNKKNIDYLSEEDRLTNMITEIEECSKLEKKKDRYKESMVNYLESLPQEKANILKDDAMDLCKKKLNKYEELDEKLDKRYFKMIDYPLGEENRFEILTEKEVELFELLLKKIRQSELKAIKKYRWEILDKEVRVKMLELLQYVKELPNWELSEEDVEDICNKLINPCWYRQCKLHTMLSEIEIYEWEEEIEQKYLELQDLSDELLLILMKKQEEKNKREDIRTEKKNEKKSDRKTSRIVRKALFVPYTPKVIRAKMKKEELINNKSIKEIRRNAFIVLNGGTLKKKTRLEKLEEYISDIYKK